MRIRPHRLVIPSLLAAALVLPVACSETKAGPEDTEQEEPAAEQDTWKRVGQLYEQAKESGEKVPGDVMDWARQEIRKVGAFEYRVVAVRDRRTPEALEAQLDALGRDRWECFQVDGGGEWAEDRLFCKRPVRSYLRAIPLRELIRLIPIGGDGGD